MVQFSMGPEPSLRPASGNTRIARRVALIGWDAADWKLIHPLLDRGLLPNLQSLIERGVMGSLATLDPPLSPVLSTSIATGLTAERHGILGFVEPDPVMGTLRPVSSTARKTKALWNILSQSGLRSVVANWFASHPAEPIQGAVVSNLYRSGAPGPEGDWPLPAGAIHPPRHEAALSELRVTPADLTAADLLPFIPQLARVDQDRDRRPLTLASILAENISVHAAATWLMEHEQWDLFAVYYDTIDHAGHVFMPYRAPRMEGITEDDFGLYREVIDGVYCFHDLMLGRLIQLAGPDTAFLIVSDHGFFSDHLRPTGESAFQLDQAIAWHRSHGMLTMAGPGIRHDELVFGAGLLDLAPTILALLGLPPAEDMRGRVLAEAFVTPPPPGRIPSWEDVPGDCGMVDPAAARQPWEAAEVIDQLIALGYLEPRQEDAAQEFANARHQQDFILARVHLSAGRFLEAIPLLEKLSADLPAELPYRLYLAQAYCEAGRFDSCRSILDPILRDAPDRPVVNLLRGNLALLEADPLRALDHLLRAEAAGPPRLETKLAIGRVHLALERWHDAERIFRSALETDQDNHAAHTGLARACYGRGDASAAADAAMTAVSLHFEDPAAHYVLGAALARLGNLDRAVRAFQTSLALRPDFAPARDALAAFGVPVSA